MAKETVEMPKMGESITEGTVIAWYKQPGDEVEMDETLLEIGTDKVDTEVPSPAAGVLEEHLVEEGETVEVGTAIATVEIEPEAAGAGGEAPSDEGDAEGTPAAEETETGDAKEEEAAMEADEDVGAQRREARTPEERAAPTDSNAPEEAEDPAPAEDAPSGDGQAGGGGEAVEVVMPKMGESITEGTIIAWHKQPGDPVDMDETILEIGTDKVDTEVPSPAEGTLREQLVDEGETVEVGTPIATLATGAPAEAPAPPTGDGAPDEAPEAPAPDPVEEDAAPAPSSEPSGDGAAGQPQPAPQGHDPQGAPGSGAKSSSIPRRGESGRFYSPLVRSIAQEEGLSVDELEALDGSGREGRVTKADVLAYLEEGRAAQPAETQEDVVEEQRAAPDRAPAERRPQPSAPQPDAGAPRAPMPGSAEGYDGRVEIQEMDRMRQITAEHMIRSKQTSAHVTSFAEADVTGLVEMRENNKEAFQEEKGVKLTFTPFFVQAAVEALQEHPVVNASVDGKQIVLKKDYHIGIAVAIGTKGLMAPVIRHADEKNLTGLARTADDLAERTRSQQLQPDELQGGTFTVTNIGSLGSTMGTPIINQPQVGILATGAIKKRPVVVEDEEMGDVIAVRHMMYACLSYDHRVIDGAMGASFLQTFTDALEAWDADDEI
jgi:2-oxoglutarate dehydrogenase E2 component (dihydrolipoamide succinyltransferase)